MKLTARFACALVVLFCVLFGAAWLILDRSVRADFQRVEAQQHDSDVRRVHASLAAYKKNLAARVNDYADWDDTRAFLMGRQPGYADSFNVEWFAKYDVDVLLFVNDKGRIVWGRNHARDGGLEASDFLFNVVLSDARAAPKTENGMRTGVVWTQHGPLLYAARPASDSRGQAGPMGLVVLGQYLSTSRLRDPTQLDLDVVSIVSPKAGAMLRASLLKLATTSAEEVSWTEDHRRESLIALRGADQRAVGAIHARHAKAVTTLGERSIFVAACLLTAVFAAAMLALWVMLNGQVIARLRALERHFDRQDDDLKPAPSEKSKDEIGRVVRAYNALAARAREALAREQQAVLDREAHARAEQIKTDFIANMSHELRTPLTAIMGYSELVQEDVRASGLDACAGDVRKIQDSAQALLGLINEILDMSKVESGQIELEPKSFDVGDMLRACADAADAGAKRAGNTLTVQCLGNLGFARTDEARLRQCVANLLSNAIKFTSNGEIVLRAERMRIENAAWVRIEVHDSGIGMSTDQMTRIFDPFMQADNSNTRRYGGMGLGLAITKRLVTLLGGQIAARSRQGFGSMFILSVPAALPTEAAVQKNVPAAA